MASGSLSRMFGHHEANLRQNDNAGCGFFLEAEAVVARRRDLLVDKKIGSVIRMQRVKLGEQN